MLEIDVCRKGAQGHLSDACVVAYLSRDMEGLVNVLYRLCRQERHKAVDNGCAGCVRKET